MFELIFESEFLPAGKYILEFMDFESDDEFTVTERIASRIKSDATLKDLGVRTSCYGRFLRLFWPGPETKLPLAVRSPGRVVRLRQMRPKRTDGTISYQVFKGCQHCNEFLCTDDNDCVICANEGFYARKRSREMRRNL